MEYNIYCDESCHLEHDDSNVMALGAIWLPKDSVSQVNNDIKEIKAKYGIWEKAELKWTKVSPSKIDMYFELIEYFFSNKALHFRCLIVPDKSILNHSEYGQTHSEWYDKMYYDMLKKLFKLQHSYYVYPDIKDTHSYYRSKELQEYLCKKRKDYNKQCIKRIQPINSREVQIMQLVDLFTGAAAYANRYFSSNHIRSQVKPILIKKIEQLSRESFSTTSEYNNTKFNILVWDPSKREVL